MARTIQQIEQSIKDNLINYPILVENITNTSDTSIAGNLISLMAEVVYEQEVSYDLFVTNLQLVIQDQVVGTLPWYAATSKNYQYGVAVEELDNGRVGYSAPVDPNLQIVTYVAATELPGLVRLKVAKEGENGNPEPLTLEELTNFRAYWFSMDFAPTFLRTPSSEILDNITSTSGDTLNITYSATISPSYFITQSDVPSNIGKNLITGEYTVGDTIADYLREQDINEFGEVFYISRLIDKIMDIPGVVNVVFSVAEGIYDGTPTDILAETGRKYNKGSGYFETVNQTPIYN